MKNRLPMIKPLVFACSVALAACGSSGGGGTAVAPTLITGTAEAPQGVIAQFEQNKSFLVAAVEYSFPAAMAGITGLQPVTGATVELIRIDDDGIQVGEVLATTVTSISGDYSLALPSGVSLAGNLIVRITGNGGASMSAMVVDQAVDINPISQFVLDKFVDDDNLVLADLAVNEVVALSGKVAEFDLTATADLATMLAQLEAQVGQFVDNEVAVIESTPDDGTVVAAASGKWHTVEMGMGLHDADAINYGTFTMDVLSEEITFSGSGNADLNLTISLGPTLIDSFTIFSIYDFTDAYLYHEISLGDAGESFPATIDAAGNISLAFGFEENLQTVDIGGANDPEADGPDYGWRYPPGSERIEPAMGGNIYVTVFNEAGVRYETTDTNNDGIKDAIDPAKRDGDEVSFDLSLFMKEGSGMGAGSISGDYGGVFLNLNVDNATTPTGVFDSTVGIVNFDGVDTVGRAADAFHVREITRTAATAPAVDLVPAESTEPASPDSFPYVVSAIGQVTMSPGGDLEGYASNDGMVVAFIDDATTGADPVTNVNNEMLVFVKLGDAMASALNGASYKLYPLAMNADTSGATELLTLGNGALTFNADSSSATVTGIERGVMRSSDVAQVEAIAASAVNQAFTISTVAANGEVTMTGTDGTFTTTLRGFVSADSKMLVMRLYGAEGDASNYDLGMVIGVKQ